MIIPEEGMVVATGEDTTDKTLSHKLFFFNLKTMKVGILSHLHGFFSPGR